MSIEAGLGPEAGPTPGLQPGPTDGPAPEPEGRRGARRAARGFARRLAATLVVLGLAVAGLGLAGALQGPRLVDASIDAEGAVRVAGRSLAIQVNQPVAAIDAAAVTVRPSTPSSAAFEGNTVTVTFDEPLRSGTEYTVHVPGVVGVDQGRPAELVSSFRTPDAELYALQRRSMDGAPDLIVRQSIAHPGAPETVFSAPTIHEFVHVDDRLVAIVGADDGGDAVMLVDPERGETQRIYLPVVGTVGDLIASPTNPLVGFAVTSPEQAEGRTAENAPFVLDLSGATGSEPRPVRGLAGGELRLMDWAFVPGTTSVVIQDYEQSLFLADALDPASIEPLGRHSEIRGFLPGTAVLVVADPDRGSTIDLADGAIAPLDLPESGFSSGRYPGRVAVLDRDGRYLVQLTSVDYAKAGTETRSMLALVDRSGGESVYEPASAGSRMQGYCVSPNGQYAAVETVDASGVPDGYPGSPGFTETTTTVVDLVDGRVRSSLAGAFPDWCRLGG